jgi:hypothetical protein
MVLPVILIAVAIPVFLAWSSWQARRRLLERIRASWGRPRERKRDMDAITDFFNLRDELSTPLDDRTWNDLLMDDVFAHLDRAESTVGQQMLYSRLRSASESLEAFEALVGRVAADVQRREQAQVALARLHDPSGYYLHRLTHPETLDQQWWHVLFPIWTATVISTLLLALLWPKLLLAAVLAFVVNFIIRILTARRVSTEINWFRQVGPLLSAASALVDIGTNDTAAITGSLASDLDALRRLGAIARWVSRDPMATNEIVLSVMEYLNVLFLMDANALYFAGRQLQARSLNLRRVIQAVGEIDAAIAVASFRAGARQWTRPRFTSTRGSATFTNLCHPLIEKAVPNSLLLSPPNGLLVTGSNMSGKSTLLRTLGVNVVLAQTTHTVLADSYEAPRYQVRSCIGRADDLLAGKSYYLVEVESVLALVRASESSEPHLFIFDELFRGTNAVERIAAAEAVLGTLIGNGRPHVTVAATHDAELVELLRETYDVCHLGDTVGPEGLSFDYRVVPGPATSRNAIALLKLNDAPDSVVNRALARAAELDRQRRIGVSPG